MTPRRATKGWGTDKPKVAGWYWWQDQFWEPECVEIYEMNDVPGVPMVSSTNLDKATALDTWDGEWLGPITPDDAALRRAKAEGMRPCFWTYNDIDECYNTGCGNAYCLVDGTLEENEHRYCPYCGHSIHEAPRAAQIEEGGVCKWKYDDIDNYYETACKHAYCLVDGTLEENEHRYCPYCGGKIEAQGGERGAI